jgi:hypothetical protein
VQRETGVGSKLEHADLLAQQLKQDLQDSATVSHNRTGDVFLRSFSWVRWQLGIQLPAEG